MAKDWDFGAGLPSSLFTTIFTDVQNPATLGMSDAERSQGLVAKVDEEHAAATGTKTPIVAEYTMKVFEVRDIYRMIKNQGGPKGTDVADWQTTFIALRDLWV